MIKQNVLFFCNTPELLRERIESLAERYTVYCISQNIIINMDEKLKEMDDVVILPYDLKRKVFAEEVWQIMKEVNQSLKVAKIRKPQYLYEVGGNLAYGVAGSYSAYLYAIVLFRKIIQDYNIDIVFCENMWHSSELYALRDITKSVNLKFYIVEMREYSWGKIKKDIYLALRKVPIIRFFILVETQLRLIYRIKNNFTKYNVDSTKEQYDIGYLLDANTNKDVNRIIENLEIEGIEKEYKYCVFCYGAYDASETLLKLGKNVKCVEGYFDLKTCLNDYKDYLWDIFAIRRQMKKSSPILFQSLNITETLKEIFFENLLGNTLSNLVHDNCVYRFLQNNQPKILLTTDSSSNRIALKTFYFNTKKLKQNVIFCNDWVGLDFFNIEDILYEYEPDSNIISSRFFSYGSRWPQTWKKMGWQGNPIYLPVDRMKKKYYKNIPYQDTIDGERNTLRVLWAPSMPALIVYSISDFIKDNMTVLESINKYNYELIVKYHPHQPEVILKNFVKQYIGIGKEKVKFISQNESIEKYINEVDIVITTPSTVIFDASLKGKLVICIVNDLLIGFTKYLKDNFYLVRREDIDFEKILYDLDFRKEQIDKQDKFWEEKFSGIDNKHMIDILQDMILNSCD